MSNNKLFSNNEIISGLTKVKKCITDIETPLKKRGILKHNENLELSAQQNKLVSMFENMKSDSFYGISINDVYSFHDGILEENENPSELIGIKTSTNFDSLAFRATDTHSNKYIWNNYRSINTSNSLNGKYLRKKATYGNMTLINPYVNAFGRKQLGTTIIERDDYICAFRNIDALSSVEINTLFCVGGFNYAFCNCKNLKEVIFNIKYAHREIPNDGDPLLKYNQYQGYGKNLTCKTYEEVPKKDAVGFNFSLTDGGVGITTFSEYEYWSSRTGEWLWTKLNFDYRTVKGGPFLKNAFEGCTALRRIAFPTLYKNDILMTPVSTCKSCNGNGGITIISGHTTRWETCKTCNGTGKQPQKLQFASIESFIDHFKLDAVSADVVFEFKDGAFHIDEMFNN